MASNRNPRESMRCLPGCVQPVLTWITGRPLEGQRPLLPRGPWWFISGTLAQLSGSAALSAWLLTQSVLWWPLLLLSITATVGAARIGTVMLLHEATHGALTGAPKLDRWLGEALSVILVLPPFERYRRDHLHHHARTATEEDPDALIFLWLGFRPGNSVRELRRHLLWTVLNPAVHVRFFGVRLAASFGEGRGRGTATVIYVAAIGMFTSLTGAWTAVGIAWLLPLTVGFQISAVLSYCALHRWFAREAGTSGREAIASLTAGTFLGDPVPADGSCRGWLIWTSRLCFVHVPLRLGVIVGDLTVHDRHHRFPAAKDWFDAAYARQRDIEAGTSGWPPYDEIWTYGAAIDDVFQRMATAAPIDPSQTTPKASGLLPSM